jgi:2,5-diketo-D-gluconate reductase B
LLVLHTTQGQPVRRGTDDLEHEVDQVTLRWLVQQDGVAAVPKSANPGRIRENFEIFDFALSGEEMSRISALHRGMRLVDPAWAPEWDAD